MFGRIIIALNDLCLINSYLDVFLNIVCNRFDIFRTKKYFFAELTNFEEELFLRAVA